MDRTALAVIVVLVVVDVVVHRVPRRLYLPTCLLVTAGLLAWARHLGLTAADLGLALGQWGPGLLWGLAVSAVVVGAVAVAVSIPSLRGLFADERATPGSDRPGVAWETGIRLPLGTVLLEEVAFRGVLLAVLLEATNRAWAIVVSAICFGLWHVIPSMGRGEELSAAGRALGTRANVGFAAGSVLATTVAGVVLGILRFLSGSLLAPMLVHWTLNASGLLAGVAVSNAAADDAEATD